MQSKDRPRWDLVCSLTCVDADVLDEAGRASGGVVAVATLELPVVSPLKAVHQDPRAVHQRGVLQAILTAVCTQTGKTRNDQRPAMGLGCQIS